MAAAPEPRTVPRAAVEGAARQVSLPRASRLLRGLVPVRIGVSGFSWDALGTLPGVRRSRGSPRSAGAADAEPPGC